VLIFSDDSRSDAGRVLEHQVKMRIPEAKAMYIDARNPAGLHATRHGRGGAGTGSDCRRVSDSAGGAQTNRIACQNAPGGHFAKRFAGRA